MIQGWQVVRRLGELGADPWVRNVFNRSALDWAQDRVVTYNASRTPEEDQELDPERELGEEEWPGQVRQVSHVLSWSVT